MSSRVQDAPRGAPASSPPVSVSGSDRDSAKVRSSINPDSLRYAFPAGASASGEHCFSDVTETFQVRGEQYLADRVKVDGGDAVFDLMHVDMFRCAEKIGNVAARSDSWLRSARAAGDTRYYLVVVYVTPASPHLHMSFYYAVQPSRLAANPHFSSLWQQFTAHGPEADAFRNERWKVIPRIAEGPWAVSYAVGTKPALLAQKLTHTWVICDGSAPEERARSHSGGGVESVGNQDASCGSSTALGMGQRGGTSISDAEGPGPYMEADCDVASSSMAFMLVSLLQSSARYLVIDLAFTIEPREEECLPEVIVGSIRLSRIDVGRPPMIDTNPGDLCLGLRGAVYGDGSTVPVEAVAASS